MVKGFEWTDEIQHGFTITSSTFWSFYYTAAGLHASHVIAGAIIMVFVAKDAAQEPGAPPRRADRHLLALRRHRLDLPLPAPLHREVGAPWPNTHTPKPHHHPNYIRIWAILLALLVVSVAGPMLGVKWLTLLTAFGIAIVKAYLVAKNFMHVNIEQRFVAYVLLTVLVFMLLFFAARLARRDEEGGPRLGEALLEDRAGGRGRRRARGRPLARR